MTIIVQRNGAQQFTADNVQITGQTFNFTDNTPPPPPQGRLLRANVRYITHAPSMASNVDMTMWKNMAGRIDATSPIQDYPHFSSTFEFTLPANNYLGAVLVANGVMSTHAIKCPVYGAGSPLRVSISLQPGDFNPLTVLKMKENVIYDDQPIFYYRNGPGTPFYVGITNGVPVYINVQAMDPTRQTNVRFASQ